MEPDRISLLNAARCLLEGKQFECDVVLPLPSGEFIEETDALTPFLLALRKGELEAKGVFSRIRLDYPELDDTANHAQLSRLSVEFRQKEQIILGIGEERHPTDIPPTAWWFEGAIWEQSILWVSIRDFFDEKQWRDLKIQPTVAFVPQRPYEFEELICFREVTLSLDDALGWADAHSVAALKNTTHNERKAGAKPTENWKEIEEYLEAEVSTGTIWTKWEDVWFSIQHLLRDPDASVGKNQPSQKLRKRLSDHNEPLLGRLREQIQTSRGRM